MDILCIIGAIAGWIMIKKGRKQDNEGLARKGTILRNVSLILLIVIWLLFVIAKYKGVIR